MSRQKHLQTFEKLLNTLEQEGNQYFQLINDSNTAGNPYHETIRKQEELQGILKQIECLVNDKNLKIQNLHLPPDNNIKDINVINKLSIECDESFKQLNDKQKKVQNCVQIVNTRIKDI
eukprot:TRINITY_DN12514_c0_g1_i1.p1 TRINITY_DN12514_c0_g1~~TRINITY_DN12514_c0_g1_i1.p1  ORF type:complete len:119 (-),score=5.42 TRINITY_DN12514_c0_g1_i1:13-369(-)